MSEDPAIQTEEPADVASAPASGRGRPRPQATLDRDDRVRDALRAGPKTRKELAEELGMTSKDVYASLWRLRHYGAEVARLDGTSQWQLAGS